MKVVVGEVTTRLRLVRPLVPNSAASDTFNAFDIAEFGALAILADNQWVFSRFAERIDEGRSAASLFLALLAPTADYLDNLREQDRCDFVDFAMGMARLKQLLACYDATDVRPNAGIRQNACLCRGHGVRGQFDQDLLAVVLRAGGWDVLAPEAEGAKDARAVVAREACDVFVLALDVGVRPESAAREVEAVRRTSRNRLIRVLAFGAVFAKDPGLAIQIGADAAAHDALSAVIGARALMSARAA